MSAGGWMMVVVGALMLVTLGFLLGSLVRSIQLEHAKRSIWRDFGLSISLAVLFFLTWIGQLISEWQRFTDEQLSHGEDPAIGDFAAEFAQSTLENWQSEFLQLFSFVVLAALLIHRGSAESKDSDEQMQKSLDRIERRLDELTASKA
jgi:purine-cytosine permease-like protein